MPSSSPSLHLPVRRRTAITAAPVAGALLATAGCRWGPEEDQTSDQATPASDPDGDPQLVEQATQALTKASALVAATSTTHIGLSSPLTPLADLHRAHRDLLLSRDGAAPSEESPPAVPGRSPKALKLVISTERTLQLTLATIAGQVASGDLARALASMSAGVAQAVTELAELKPSEAP